MAYGIRQSSAQASTPCRFCASRWRGACKGVDAHDALGLSALEAAKSPLRIYEAGDVIYTQGDPNTHVFNLISGWVEVHRDTADGRRQIVQFLQPGAFFGLEPDDEELGESAMAITNAVICPITTNKFHELRRSIPSLDEHFISLLQRDSRSLVKALTGLGLGNAKERIGGLLWRLAVTGAGQLARLQEGCVVPMPLTQRHIAEATGLTSIHVNRVLRQLRENHVVELRDAKLTILNVKKLRAIAEPGVDLEAVMSSERREFRRGMLGDGGAAAADCGA